MSRRADVVVVGSVNRDYVCRVEVLPTPGQTVLGGEASVLSGGKGGNQAVAASLLGAQTALVASVGADDDGRAVTRDLTDAGVDTSRMLASEARTGMAFVMVDASGENSIVVAAGANAFLDGPATDRAVGVLLSPSGVVVTQAEIPVAAFEAAVLAAEAAGCRAVVNLAPYRPVAEGVLALCDPLVINESEASGLLGRDVRGADRARTAVEDLLGRCRSVVITIGEGGALVGRRESQPEVELIPAERVEVVDTTGAGDAFTGALAAALSAGSGLVEAARVGVRAGTYAVCGLGAQSSFPTFALLGLGPLRPPADLP